MKPSTENLSPTVNSLDNASPLVSVIMSAYNSADVLPRAIASVQAQSFTEWELIIVDDGSTDGTYAVASEFAGHDPRIRVFAQGANRGVAIARNKAINAANARYIAFLDADDTWLRHKLERQIGWMQSEGIAFSFSAFLRGHGAEWSLSPVPAKVSYSELLRGNVIGCLTAVYDAEVLGNLQMPELRRRQDYALWLRILNELPFAHGLDEPLACYHCDPDRASLSSNLIKSVIGTLRVYLHEEGLSWPKAVWCLFRHLTRYRGSGVLLTNTELSELGL